MFPFFRQITKSQIFVPDFDSIPFDRKKWSKVLPEKNRKINSYSECQNRQEFSQPFTLFFYPLLWSSQLAAAATAVLGLSVAAVPSFTLPFRDNVQGRVQEWSALSVMPCTRTLFLNCKIQTAVWRCWPAFKVRTCSSKCLKIRLIRESGLGLWSWSRRCTGQLLDYY